MKKVLLSLVLFLVSTCFYGQNIKLNKEVAEVEFFFHGENVNGSLEGFDADIQLNMSDIEKSKIKGSVKVNTINTGIKMRNKHLISSDFFHADKYPKMKFRSTKIEVHDDVIYVDGIMTIKETEKAERFELKVKDEEIVFTSRINTADYDVMSKNKREKTNVDITITIPKKG